MSTRILKTLALGCVIAIAAGCATFQTGDKAKLEIAQGDTPPRFGWKTVSLTDGVSFGEADAVDKFWLRATRPSMRETQIYGPYKLGDVIDAGAALDLSGPWLVALEHEPSLANLGSLALPSSSGPELLGFTIRKPRITVGRSRARIGPIKIDTPNIPAPKVDITIGGGGSGGGGGGGNPPVSRAGLEPDPVRQPGDVFCHAPIRAFNRESFPVRVTWREVYKENGPGCTARHETDEGRSLRPGAHERVLCSLQTSPSSTCSQERSYRNVKVERVN